MRLSYREPLDFEVTKRKEEGIEAVRNLAVSTIQHILDTTSSWLDRRSSAIGTLARVDIGLYADPAGALHWYVNEVELNTRTFLWCRDSSYIRFWANAIEDTLVHVGQPFRRH